MTFFKALGGLIEETNKSPNVIPIIFCFGALQGKVYDRAEPSKFPKEFKKTRCVMFNDYKKLPTLLKKKKICLYQ